MVENFDKSGPEQPFNSKMRLPNKLKRISEFASLAKFGTYGGLLRAKSATSNQ